MSANRYGQIWHGDHHHINIRFPSAEARLKFQNEFEAYHASHDHEGDVPIFKCVTTKDLKLSTGSRSPQDLVKAETDKDYRITIDGYSWNEIHEYHNPSGWSDYFWYRVPTCCVPPTIVVDREFVDSGTLKRHELSGIFGVMPETDFQSLLESVQTDGFIDPIIRIHEGHILDGWHRYRAAQELNLIRRLRFREWREDRDEDGDPKAFVLARNIERRHLSPQQRGQIVVAFNNRFGQGNIKAQRADSDSPNGEPKTRQELAKEAGVSTRTIDRAIAVDKAGQSEVVIRGDKTPGQLEREAKEKRYAKLCKAINAFNRVWQKTQLATQVSLSDDFFPAAAEALGFPINTVEQVYRCQDSPESEKKMKGFTGLGIDSWERYFDAMRTALIEKPEWVESLESGTHTEDALEHLYQNRQNFQTAVSDFAQSGAYLDFAYCRCRIKSLVGLEDSTDEESTDYTQWDLQKIKAQSHLITETVQVIRGYLEEDPKIETHPVAELLSEMQRISEIHQSAKLDTYTPPFLHQPLSDAALKVEKLWTADWEAKSDEARLDDLNALEAELPSLIEAEDTARETDEKTASSDGISVAPAEDTVDSLWEQITPAIAAWKSERKGQGVGHASKTMFISATKRFHDLPQECETDVDLLQKLLALVTAIQGRMYTFERYVKMQCDGASIWRTDETADVPASDSSENRADESESLSSGNGVESRRLQASQHPRFSAEEQTLTESESTPTSEPEKPDWEQKQREHVNRLESLPGEIRQLLPTWQQAHGIEGTLTLKLLLNARKHIEFGRERGPDPFFREEMEDLLQRMKSNDEGFVKKVRELLRGAEPAQEQSNSVAQYEQTLTLIEKLKDGLKKVHVVDVEEFVEDILHFYNGIGVDELLLSPAETLKNITDFIEGFVDEPLQAWPEYIRDSHHIPKRELVLVSIGISNNTDDEFELVEFTDESSDEIRCELNALPEDLRTALLKLASEMIYAEKVKGCHVND